MLFSTCCCRLLMLMPPPAVFMRAVPAGLVPMKLFWTVLDAAGADQQPR